ncbi:K+/H+ antiporter subunit F [Oligella urethralis]|uniref:K+/H+ antiporter subunit F n=1 Tax=Oligella urethralis TaxID=90245 RepID=UPI00254CEAC4|nr:K+/H+ antiporter subunit F [Oligella urethralis]MDK6202064.1 K+/H+ antiporter subunit F [Oligella urethralis]
MGLLNFTCYFAIACYSLSNVLTLYRAIKGPTPQDRVLSADVTYTNCMLLVFTLGILFRTPWYYDIGLLIALLGFVTTAAMAKFLLRGEVIEP